MCTAAGSRRRPTSRLRRTFHTPDTRPFCLLAPAWYRRRVTLAYEQALMVLFHYPDTWLDFAAWHAGGGGAGPAAAAAVLEKGRGALPEALALHFAAADLQVGAC